MWGQAHSKLLTCQNCSYDSKTSKCAKCVNIARKSQKSVHTKLLFNKLPKKHYFHGVAMLLNSQECARVYQGVHDVPTSPGLTSTQGPCPSFPDFLCLFQPSPSSQGRRSLVQLPRFPGRISGQALRQLHGIYQTLCRDQEGPDCPGLYSFIPKTVR